VAGRAGDVGDALVGAGGGRLVLKRHRIAVGLQAHHDRGVKCGERPVDAASSNPTASWAPWEA